MSKKQKIRQDGLVRMKRTRGRGTRKVLVRMYGRQVVLLRGDIVLEVPVELTDEEVAERIQNEADLPEPEWYEFDCWPLSVEVQDDVPIAVVCEVGAGRKAHARLVVDEDGDQEIVS